LGSRSNKSDEGFSLLDLEITTNVPFFIQEQTIDKSCSLLLIKYEKCRYNFVAWKTDQLWDISLHNGERLWNISSLVLNQNKRTFTDSWWKRLKWS
jgi:hypothetical protein